MKASQESSAFRVLSGEDRSLRAALLRGALRIAEPVYAGAMSARNSLYTSGLFRSRKLPAPTISVGNLTTGGTGKTPMVRWLAEQFIAKNLRPAILMRGYRAEETGGSSDEAEMLSQLLGDRAAVVANPNRVAGAKIAMVGAKKPDVFLLDDAFQHRRVRRDFDVVLVNAAEPFGFGHLLPRGLLRESMHGLARADAIVVTRANAVTGDALQQVTTALRYWNNYVSIYIADHVHASLLTREGEKLPVDALREKRFFAFAGIASPASLKRQFESYGPTFAGLRAFPDHHAYTAADLEQIATDASAAGAELIVTTEKDWVKVQALPAPENLPPIVRTELQIRFRQNHGEELMARIMQRIIPAALGRALSSSLPAAGSASRGAAKGS
ncbi:MAG: tetraacyldisaccharide 4-kinase [Humisphaera sp.]|nr:tetraacyldisaccharide 4-kinase [Humisphaera sp.]